MAGFHDHEGFRYLHLGPGGEARVTLTAATPARPHLREANGFITRLERRENELTIGFEGHLPLVFTLGLMDSYAAWSGDQPLTPVATSAGLARYSLTGNQHVITVKKKTD